MKRWDELEVVTSSIQSPAICLEYTATVSIRVITTLALLPDKDTPVLFRVVTSCSTS